jgi:hypothetical protein
MKMKMKDQMKDVHPAKRIRSLLLPVRRHCFRCRIGSRIIMTAVQTLERRCMMTRELRDLAIYVGRALQPL